MRQYIGARYTIKIYENSQDPSSAEWEEGGTYEPLTMVTYLNSSYLSKKDVPPTVGNPAENPSYWVVTGAYNGQIASLQSQIDTIVNTILPAISDAISAVSDKADALDTEVGDLDELVTPDKSSVVKAINSLSTKSKTGVIVIGNSYVGNSGRECTAKFEQLFDTAYRTYAGGIGFVTYTGHSTNFETQLDIAIADTSLDNDDITDILFVSAVGDTNALEEFGGSYGTALFTTLESMKTKIATNFPNIKRIMVTLAESRNSAIITSSYVGTNKYKNMFTIHRLFRQYLASYGYEYMGWSGFNNLFESAYFESDNYHPSVVGASVLDENIIRQYFGSFEYATKHGGASIDCKYTSDSKIYIQTSMTPEVATVNTRVLNQGSGGSIVLAANDVMVDFEDLPIPLPAPIDTAPVIPCRLVKNDAITTLLDNLLIGLETSSNGVLEYKTFTAPTISTAAGSAYIPELCELTFLI